MEIVAEHEVSVVLSSHLIAISNGSVTTWSFSSPPRFSWPARSLNCSRRITPVWSPPGATLLALQLRGHRREPHRKQSTFLVRTDQPILDPAWIVTPVTLDELVLAYMAQARNPARVAGPD